MFRQNPVQIDTVEYIKLLRDTPKIYKPDDFSESQI